MRTVRRAARFLLAGATAVTAFAVAPGMSTSSNVAEAAPDDIVAIVLEGTGNGHGRGMSQWGAYGWAVNHGWGWERILDHYYGGTTLGDVSTAQTRIKVRLLALDGAANVGVVSHGPGVAWNGETRSSMRAQRVGSGYDVYGSTSIACPSAATLTVPSGNPTIGIGSSNSAAVSQIQAFLKAFHNPSIGVDGQFGPQTDTILRSWQAAQDLAVDGVWHPQDATRANAQIASRSGSVTWEKLGSSAGPVRFTTSNGENSGVAPENVLGLCNGAGAITHYRGALEVSNQGGSTRVVNDVKTEDYLRGVVPKEVSASWANAGGGAGANSVRAQAVAARSYGLQQNRYAPYATTCDSQACQVYGGSATRATANSTRVLVEDTRTDQAIAATAGKVRKWPNGSIVSTEFSASNGPRTAGGAFPPVDDTPGDSVANNPNHRWTRVLDAASLASRYGLGTITSASMVDAAASQYREFDGIWFNDIVLAGTSGTKRMQAWDFRRDFGLPSPGFTVRVVRSDTTSSTFGMIGDSVGNSIAQAGSSAFRILTKGTFSSTTISVRDDRCTARTDCSVSTGVQAAASLPMGLDLVVVELGYNDSGRGSAFSSDIDAMMNALRARGVRQVLWVNMADIRTSGGSSVYAPLNSALAAATSRHSNLTVLDWNAASRHGEARARWFTDGVHLTVTGRAEFSSWLRDQIVGAAPSHSLSPPKRIELPVVGVTVTSPSGQALTVPQNAAGVALNVTMVRPTSGGFATVWPCQQARPVVSSLNARGGEVVANNVIAPISASGTVCFYSSVGTDFIVDIAGWFSDSAGPNGAAPFVGLLPQRVVDTRGSTRVGPSSPLVVRVASLPAARPDGSSVTVPADVAAVAVNVTVARSQASGFATVWPCGTERPNASNVNFEANNPTGNGVVAPVGDDGTICIHTSTTADVIVDLAGYFDRGAFNAAIPTRFVDTRSGIGGPTGRVAPSTPLRVQVRGERLDADASAGGPDTLTIPDDAAAVAMNVTAVRPSGGGFATVWPCGSAQPVASNLNFAAGQNRANSVIAPIGADGTVCVHVSSSADVLVDVAGWFSGGADASFVGAVPKRLVDTRIALGPMPS